MKISYALLITLTLGLLGCSNNSKNYYSDASKPVFINEKEVVIPLTPRKKIDESNLFILNLETRKATQVTFHSGLTFATAVENKKNTIYYSFINNYPNGTEIRKIDLNTRKDTLVFKNNTYMVVNDILGNKILVSYGSRFTEGHMGGHTWYDWNLGEINQQKNTLQTVTKTPLYRVGSGVYLTKNKIIVKFDSGDPNTGEEVVEYDLNTKATTKTLPFKSSSFAKAQSKIIYKTQVPNSSIRKIYLNTYPDFDSPKVIYSASRYVSQLALSPSGETALVVDHVSNDYRLTKIDTKTGAKRVIHPEF